MNKKNNTKRKKLVEIDKNDGGDKDRKRKKNGTRQKHRRIIKLRR